MPFSTSLRLAVVTLSATLLSACGGDGDSASALSDDEGILRFVPADTLFAAAVVEPMPDALLDKLEPATDAMFRSYADEMQAVMDQAEAEINANGGGLQQANLGRLVRELLSLMQSDNQRAAGIGRSPRVAIYGLGLVPVFRAELANPVAFEAKIAEIQSEIGGELDTAEVDGSSYRYIDAGEVRLVVAVVDDYAVLSFAPANASDNTMARILGTELPRRSIADAGTLAELSETYGFTGHGAGFMDLERLAAALLDEREDADAELFWGDRMAGLPISATCRADYLSMAGVVPRLAFGYTGVSVDAIDTNSVLEVRSDIAEGMSALTAPVPGLGGDSGAVGSAGFSLNLAAAREFIEARLDAYEADPYECEQLAGLQQGIAQIRAGLAQPVPPIAYSLRGLLLVVDRLEGVDPTRAAPPQELDARLLVASDNAPALVQMGAMFSPEIQALGLEPNGVPKALDLPMQAGDLDGAYVAMTDSAIALSIGGSDGDSLTELLDSDPPERAPLFSLRMDGDRFRELIEDSMANAPQASDAANDGRMPWGAAEVVDRFAVDVLLTGRGVEMPSRTSLK